MPHILIALALLVPALAAAQVAPAEAAPAATAPAQAPAAAPVPQAPTAAPATPVAPVASPAVSLAPPEKEYGSWVVLKGGWFGTSEDYQGDSFSGSGEWELAVGTGRLLGIELGFGSMTTSAGGLEVRSLPLLLTLRLALPIAMVSPYVLAGGGVYFNRATIGDRSVDAATGGWHVGLGCDVAIKRFVVGAEVRYMGIAPTFSTIGTITLDRYAALLRAGIRF